MAAGRGEEHVDGVIRDRLALRGDPALDMNEIAAERAGIGRGDVEARRQLLRILRDGGQGGVGGDAIGTASAGAVAARRTDRSGGRAVRLLAIGDLLRGQAADVALELRVLLLVLLRLRERILGARRMEALVLGVRDVHAERGAAEVDALPAALGEPHLDERVRFVLDVARGDAERVRGDHERERAVTAHAGLRVAQIAVDVAGGRRQLLRLERAEVGHELVERVGQVHVGVDADLVERGAAGGADLLRHDRAQLRRRHRGDHARRVLRLRRQRRREVALVRVDVDDQAVLAGGARLLGADVEVVGAVLLELERDLRLDVVRQDPHVGRHARQRHVRARHEVDHHVSVEPVARFRIGDAADRQLGEGRATYLQRVVIGDRVERAHPLEREHVRVEHRDVVERAVAAGVVVGLDRRLAICAEVLGAEHGLAPRVVGRRIHRGLGDDDLARAQRGRDRAVAAGADHGARVGAGRRGQVLVRDGSAARARLCNGERGRDPTHREDAHRREEGGPGRQAHCSIVTRVTGGGSRDWNRLGV